jgi:thermitase
LGRIFIFYFPAAYKNIKGAVSSYDQLPEVEYAHLDWYCQLTAVPNDPEYKNLNQWYLYRIKAEPAWDTSKGTDVVIAILDTGVAHEHPDLDAKIVAGYDFYNDDNDPEDESYLPHGTMVSGLAAAETNNGIGIAALGWESQIMPLQISEIKGNTKEPTPDVMTRCAAKAVKWAVDHYADIISMSFGAPHGIRYWGTQAFKDGCGFAYKLNLFLAASAGNNPNVGVQ